MYKFFVVIFLLAVFQPISSFSDSKCPSLFEVKSQESANLRNLVLDEDGKVREKFKNMEGQALLSEEYFAGKNMWDVFWLTSTVLDTKDFLQLNWQQLDLTLEEYKKMRSYLLDSDGNGKEKYKGARGISFFANRFFKKDREKALLYATKIFGEKVLKQLAWWEQAQMAVKRAQIDAKNRAQNRRGVINSIRLRNKRNNISMR